MSCAGLNAHGSGEGIKEQRTARQGLPKKAKTKQSKPKKKKKNKPQNRSGYERKQRETGSGKKVLVMYYFLIRVVITHM